MSGSAKGALYKASQLMPVLNPTAILNGRKYQGSALKGLSTDARAELYNAVFLNFYF